MLWWFDEISHQQQLTFTLVMILALFSWVFQFFFTWPGLSSLALHGGYDVICLVVWTSAPSLLKRNETGGRCLEWRTTQSFKGIRKKTQNKELCHQATRIFVDPYIEFKAYLFMIPVVFHPNQCPLKSWESMHPHPKPPTKIKGFN